MRAGLIGPVAFLLTGVSSFCLLAGSPALGFHFSGATGATDCSNLNMADKESNTDVYVHLQSENAESMN